MPIKKQSEFVDSRTFNNLTQEDRVVSSEESNHVPQEVTAAAGNDVLPEIHVPEKAAITIPNAGLPSGTPGESTEWTTAAAAPQGDRRSITSPENGKKGGRPCNDINAMADGFLLYCTNNQPERLKYWKSNWWLYDDESGWREDEDIKVAVAKYLKSINYQISCNVCKNILFALQGSTSLSSRLTRPFRISTGENGRDFIAFPNGLVKISDLKTLPLNEVPIVSDLMDFFGSRDVDYIFDPAATCPNWEEYIRTTFPDEEMRSAYQKMLGYIIGRSLKLNVAFFGVGPAGSGKTTTASVLQSLVGTENCSHVHYSEFSEKYTSFFLTECTLNIADENPNRSSRGGVRSEEMLKNITGGGTISVEKKYQNRTNGDVIARNVFFMNSLPEFTDLSDGLWDRIVVILFTERFRGTDSQKRDYTEILRSELPGIFNWAVTGLKALQGESCFPVPAASREYLAAHRRDCDVLGEMLQSRYCASDNPDDVVPEKEITEFVNAPNNYLANKGKYKRSEIRAAFGCRFPRAIAIQEYRKKGLDCAVWQYVTTRETAAAREAAAREAAEVQEVIPEIAGTTEPAEASAKAITTPAVVEAIPIKISSPVTVAVAQAAPSLTITSEGFTGDVPASPLIGEKASAVCVSVDSAVSAVTDTPPAFIQEPVRKGRRGRPKKIDTAASMAVDSSASSNTFEGGQLSLF